MGSVTIPVSIFRRIVKGTRLRRIETRTFRIDTDVSEQLDDLAQKEKVRVNVIANRSLRKYVEYDAYAEKFGLVTISKGLLKTFFSLITDEQARILGKKSGEHEGVALITFWFKDFNLENVIKSFDRVASRYNHNFEFEFSHDGQAYVAILRHDCGPRASVFYAEFVKSVFALLDVKVELEEAEDQIVAKLFVQKPDEQLAVGESFLMI
jgi:predicted transcriptional regulator